MKKVIVFIVITSIILCSCGKYNQPDADALMDELCLSQGLEDMTEADDSAAQILFDISLEDVESYSIKYSSQGGYADMIAIFKMNSEDNAASAEQTLKEYKDSRYEDFKGYAPLEARKVEDGRVLVYDKYVLLVIVPNIDEAIKTVETEFTE